jgi:long-chain fatty acid transport protein
MSKKLNGIKKFQIFLLLCLSLFPLTLRASFIESTIGAAVVNDATATFYNPAALVLIKKPQIIALNTIGQFRSQFTGQAIQSRTGFIQSGSSVIQTNYYLPSIYLGIPTRDKITFGLAAIANSFNKDLDGNSILRYAQANNSVQNFDVVPAVAYKFNDMLSFGAGIKISYANFLLKRTLGFPSLNIPDSQSRNECDGTGVGGDLGVLLKASKSTIIGLNYRTAVTYRLTGKSVFEDNPEIFSNNYGFTFWTPARIVLSTSQFITPKLGVIGTIQRIEWSILKEINIHGIATPIGILNASVPYHLHDTWLLTLGGQYRITPKWIIRAASSYNQSPANSNFQISNGDSIILGASMGYELSKNILIDGSYAHAFIQNQSIHVTTAPNIINGVTKGAVNVVSLKLTFKLA